MEMAAATAEAYLAEEGPSCHAGTLSEHGSDGA